jgi:hypothetical protein
MLTHAAPNSKPCVCTRARARACLCVVRVLCRNLSSSLHSTWCVACALLHPYQHRGLTPFAPLLHSPTPTSAHCDLLAGGSPGPSGVPRSGSRCTSIPHHQSVWRTRNRRCCAQLFDGSNLPAVPASSIRMSDLVASLTHPTPPRSFARSLSLDECEIGWISDDDMEQRRLISTTKRSHDVPRRLASAPNADVVPASSLVHAPLENGKSEPPRLSSKLNDPPRSQSKGADHSVRVLEREGKAGGRSRSVPTRLSSALVWCRLLA